MIPTIGILTPTIGNPELLRCLRSVATQILPRGNMPPLSVIHYVVIDGEEHVAATQHLINELPSRTHIRTIILQENVGKGYYGHRVFGSVPMLMNTDFVSYLDEDNFFKPNHCTTLYAAFTTPGTQWAYSLRSIYDKHENYVCDDNCESLGMWDAYQGNQIGIPPLRHIDTSCYLVPINLARMLGPTWFGQWGQDRVFFKHLRQIAPHFVCSREHTVCYRLAGNSGSVSALFFQQGNAASRFTYPAGFPWHREDVSCRVHVP